MITLYADLHVHTALSPCAADEMTPPRIVRTALERGLSLIAICDHNAAGNVAACVAAAEGTPLGVLAGIEITTAEEVHVVGVFPDAGAANAVAGAVQATLPPGDDEYYRRFGEQFVLDATGGLVAIEDRMLALASALDLAAAVGLIHRHGGLAIAAHANRPAFGVFSQLGVFPREAGFDAVEVFTPARQDKPGTAPGGTARTGVAPVPRAVAETGLPVLASSDAHCLADIGRCRTCIAARAASFPELALALRGAEGRGVACA